MKDLETERLSEKLQEYEDSLLESYGLEDVEGGFVNIEVQSYDDDFIYVEVSCGSDEEKESYEDLTINRKTLEWDN